MLYVRYVHLTKVKPIHKRQSHQRGCYIRTKTARAEEEKKTPLVVSVKGLGAKMNLVAVNRQL
jgi:hypothetical protein